MARPKLSSQFGQLDQEFCCDAKVLLPQVTMANTVRTLRYVFTLNNYTSDDVNRIVEQVVPISKYVVFGYEEAPTTGTPHLQGFVILVNRMRFRQFKTVLNPRAFVSVAHGSDEEASEYCKKSDYEEFGDIPARTQGKRTDWEKFEDWVVDLGRVPSFREIARSGFRGLLARYHTNIFKMAEAFLPTTDYTEGETPRFGFQSYVVGRVEGQMQDGAPRRVIDFVVDPAGNSGKSWVASYLISKYPDDVQILRVAKRDDMALALDVTKRVFFFDVPRNQMQFFQYPILEMLKDRMVFSPKYLSGMKCLSSVPTVIVLCNEAPDMTQMTGDRYNIINVTPANRGSVVTHVNH